MPVDHKRKLAFCHIPRTGGVSICNALNLEVIEKHEPASWYRKKFPDYFLFTVIRPYHERIYSAFAGKIPEDKNTWIDELILRQYISKHSDYEIRKENAIIMLKPNEYFIDTHVDAVIDFHHLESHLNFMLKQFDVVVELKKTNSFI